MVEKTKTTQDKNKELETIKKIWNNSNGSKVVCIPIDFPFEIGDWVRLKISKVQNKNEVTK